MRCAGLGGATPPFRCGAVRPHDHRATGNSPRPRGCVEVVARHTSFGVGWQTSSCAYTPEIMQNAANTSARAFILAEEAAAGCVTEEGATTRSRDLCSSKLLLNGDSCIGSIGTDGDQMTLTPK